MNIIKNKFYLTLNPKWVEVKKKNLACFVYSFAINKRTLIYSFAVNQTLYPLFTKEKERNINIKQIKVKKEEYDLETFKRSNQDTCLIHKPSVIEGNWVQSGDLLTDCASSVGGELSLGQNLLIAYMPWEGYNFEDAILISERLVIDDLYTSVHIERYELETQQTKLGSEEITRHIPDVSEKELSNLDSFGIVKKGSWVEEGDILVGKITPINKKKISPYQKLLYTILEKQVRPIKDSSLRAPKGIKAKVIDIKYFLKTSNYLRIPLSTVSLQKRTALLPFLKKEKGSIKKTEAVLYKKINSHLKKDNNGIIKKVRDTNSLNLLLSYEQGRQDKGHKTTIFFNKLNKMFSRHYYYKQINEKILYYKEKKYINSYNITGFSKLSDFYLFKNKMNLIFTSGSKNEILANRCITFNPHKLLSGKQNNKQNKDENLQNSFFLFFKLFRYGLDISINSLISLFWFSFFIIKKPIIFALKKKQINGLTPAFVFGSTTPTKVKTNKSKSLNFSGGLSQKQKYLKNQKRKKIDINYPKSKNLLNLYLINYLNRPAAEKINVTSFVTIYLKKILPAFHLKKQYVSLLASLITKDVYLFLTKTLSLKRDTNDLLKLCFGNKLFLQSFFFCLQQSCKQKNFDLQQSCKSNFVNKVYKVNKETSQKQFAIQNFISLAYSNVKKILQNQKKNKDNYIFFKQKVNKYKKKNRVVFAKQKQPFVNEINKNLQADEKILKPKNKEIFVSSKLTKFAFLIAKIPFWQNVSSIVYQKNKQELPTSLPFINGRNTIKKQKIKIETNKANSQSLISPYLVIKSKPTVQANNPGIDQRVGQSQKNFDLQLRCKSNLVTEKLHKKATLLKNIEKIVIYLAEKRKIQVGDKMAGRHGNKGIVSKILPIQDMPFLPDGTSIDMVLNPLGVPSRMNVGQIYECLLGLAGKFLGENYKITCFDEIFGPEASRSFVFNKLYEARIKTGFKWLFDPNSPGKIRIYDGRNGECFDQKITVGQAYILRLVHMVDDKIHMRSTGPYSLVTQQPLRGRSKQGGQRLGEMEVWALEGYGAAFTLLEMLTIKSDDMTGRMTLWSKLILNKDISIGTPESFKVLICELQALCLDIGLFRYNDLNKEPSHFITGKAINQTGGLIYKNNFNNLREITNLINLP